MQPRRRIELRSNRGLRGGRGKMLGKSGSRSGFHKKKDPVTGEMYWESNGAYWERRNEGNWAECDDIF